jgi:hypothetical protein
MPEWTRTTITPGDRVTVEIQHSNRPVLQPLIGLLRTVEVTTDHRAIIYEEDGSRYRFNERTVPPVRLGEASIITNPATGELWAHVYHLPPRDSSPYPLDPRSAPIAEPDAHGGIARMLSCWCGRGCVCSVCGEATMSVALPSRLYWVDHLVNGKPHGGLRCSTPSCPSTAAPNPTDGPECCAKPMRLAPVAWVCRRESAHQRPYRWPQQPGLDGDSCRAGSSS